MRFIYLQLNHKILGREFIFRMTTGTIMKAFSNSTGTSGFFYYQLPDYEEQKFVLDRIKQNDLFVDIGANVGGWSLLAAGKGAFCIAIEPIPETYQKLLFNIALNKDLKIDSLNIGLGKENSDLVFTADKDTGNHMLVNEKDYTGKTIKVPVKKLDDIIATKDPRFIKIDVEGFEYDVLLGASQALKKASLQALIIETFRWANYKHQSLIDMEQMLAENGFFPCSYDPESKKLNKLKNKNEGGQNTIYAKEQMIYQE